MDTHNGSTDILLFDSSILAHLDWSKKKCSFKKNITPSEPGKNLLLRPLSLFDFNKGYLQLLADLTHVGIITEDEFQKRFYSMQKCSNTYYIIVLEDLDAQKIIGSATLQIEQKFIHCAGQRGRIEDVVIDENYRGMELGKLLVQTLTLLGEYLGCYKLSLECRTDKVPFYNAFGFDKDKFENHFLVQRFLP